MRPASPARKAGPSRHFVALRMTGGRYCEKEMKWKLRCPLTMSCGLQPQCPVQPPDQWQESHEFLLEQRPDHLVGDFPIGEFTTGRERLVLEPLPSPMIGIEAARDPLQHPFLI